jgi:hypothetical protein
MHAEEQQKRQVNKRQGDVQETSQPPHVEKKASKRGSSRRCRPEIAKLRQVHDNEDTKGYAGKMMKISRDVVIMIKTYENHPNLSTLTALPPITSSLPFSSVPNTPLTALSFVLTESHSVSPSSSGGKNG